MRWVCAIQWNYLRSVDGSSTNTVTDHLGERGLHNRRLGKTGIGHSPRPALARAAVAPKCRYAATVVVVGDHLGVRSANTFTRKKAVVELAPLCATAGDQSFNNAISRSRRIRTLRPILTAGISPRATAS